MSGWVWAVVLAQNLREEKRPRVFARSGSIEYLGLGPAVPDARLREVVGGEITA